MLNFEKRDLILIAGLLFFMIGLIPFMGAIYAVLIVIVMYFGIKFYVVSRKKSISKEIEGICADCGGKITNQNCPQCNPVNK